MPGKSRLFFYECRPGQCEVISIDYDIAIAARSLDEAKSILKVAIDTYVDDANALPEPARSRLLKRRMPRFVQFQWMLRMLRNRLNLLGRQSSEVGRLEVLCHA
jgi:hypothetical protein